MGIPKMLSLLTHTVPGAADTMLSRQDDLSQPTDLSTQNSNLYTDQSALSYSVIRFNSADFMISLEPHNRPVVL